MSILYEPDLPERIYEWPGREVGEWWELRPVGAQDDMRIPPLDDYLHSLGSVGYTFETIPWPPSDSWPEVIYAEAVAQVRKNPMLGPHFDIPNNTLKMPSRCAFRTLRSYYRAALHELSHSTAHASRLNRMPTNALSNRADYAREECIADLSGALLFVNLGGDPETLMSSWAHYVHYWEAHGPTVVDCALYMEARKSARWMLNEVFE